MRCRVLFLALAFAASRAGAADAASEASDAYTLLTAGSTERVKVGEPGKLVVTIQPKGAWHVHPQAPLKVRVQPPPGLRVEKTVLGRRDVVDPKAEAPRLEAGFVATSAGRHEAKAEVDFFVCSETACVKQVRTVGFAVSAY